jgi:hypothetical protein
MSIVEESDWDPFESEKEINHVKQKTASDDHLIGIKIAYNEKELRDTIKKEGGIWDNQQKVWFISLQKAVELDLINRIAPVNL